MAVTEHRSADIEKNTSLHIDDVASSEKDLKTEAPPGADYAGAVAKSDPAEIALVRKLDYRIMPSLFCMYFLYVYASILPSYAHISNIVSGISSIKMPSPTHVSITLRSTFICADHNTILASASSMSGISSHKFLPT